MSWVSSLFGGGSGFKNPADAAQPYYQQMPEYINQYTQPYIDTGMNAGTQNASIYSQMAGDPTGYYNDIYSSYEPSDYYKYQSDQMAKTASNTAAAGGFSGTESDIQKQTEQQNALLSADWQQYLNNVLGIQGSGLQGNQAMYNTGAGFSTQALNDYMAMLSGQAQMAYGGAQQENQYNAMNNSSALGGLAGAAGLAAYAVPSLYDAGENLLYDAWLGF